MAVTLCLSQDPAADALLSRDPLALLIGMVLDQQVALEKAFRGPFDIIGRLRLKKLDAAELAAWDPDDLVETFVRPPAIHRYPAAMAKRVQDLCQAIVEEYGGSAERIWSEAGSGEELLKRVRALPGFGDQKAKIFVALLGKQLEVTPPGWREAAGIYGEEGSTRSVADITDAESLAKVRAFKQEMKQAAKEAAPPTKPGAKRKRPPGAG